MNYETMLNMLMQGLEQNVRNNNNINSLKKQNKLSSMFNEGEMLDYYDLSTERGRRGKKKNV